MAERKKGLQPKPTDPDLLPSQVAFKIVSDEILRHKTNNRVSFVHFSIETDPAELLQRLAQSSLRDLLLQPGESLSVPQPDDHYPDLGLVVGKTPLSEVGLTHLGWQERKWRIDPDGPKIPPFKIIEYPGESDWMREIDISIWFGKGINRAVQRLSLYDTSRNAGVIPQISRVIYAPEYAETGYEGHNRKSRHFKDEAEVMFFVNLSRELFDKRAPVTKSTNPS